MTSKTFKVARTDAEWRALLTPEQYDVLRRHGTEPPGSCALNHEKRAGAFYCVGCGQELFRSAEKFESGTGWPSFYDPIDGRGGDQPRRQPFHGPHRGALQPMRRPSRPCL